MACRSSRRRGWCSKTGPPSSAMWSFAARDTSTPSPGSTRSTSRTLRSPKTTSESAKESPGCSLLCEWSSLFLRFFKHMLPKDHRGDLAFVGFARPAFGAIPPISELQCRYLAQLWSGQAALPSEERMEELAKFDEEFYCQRWVGLGQVLLY